MLSFGQLFHYTENRNHYEEYSDFIQNMIQVYAELLRAIKPKTDLLRYAINETLLFVQTEPYACTRKEPAGWKHFKLADKFLNTDFGVGVNDDEDRMMALRVWSIYTDDIVEWNLAALYCRQQISGESA